jgi:hypothetical protein
MVTVSGPSFFGGGSSVRKARVGRVEPGDREEAVVEVGALDQHRVIDAPGRLKGRAAARIGVHENRPDQVDVAAVDDRDCPCPVGFCGAADIRDGNQFAGEKPGGRADGQPDGTRAVIGRAADGRDTPKVPFAPVALAPELLKVIEALTSGVSPKSRVWVRVSAPCANRSYLNPCLSRVPNDGGIQG